MAKTTLFVGNISFKAEERDLADLVSKYKPASIRFCTDRATGKPRGFAFVDLPDPTTAEEMRKVLDGSEFMGRPLRVREADERPPRGASRPEVRP